ncbi:MAG: hypothetical protein ACT4PX_03525 [Actinomycetota bacterium]
MRSRSVVLVMAAALGALPVSPASAQEQEPPATAPPTAVVAVWTSSPVDNLRPVAGSREPADPFLRHIDAMGMAPGLVSASQGRYDRLQALLDISQGSRQPGSLYDPRSAPALRVQLAGAGASVAGWDVVRDRARRVSTTLRPGLLAASVPGGAAFVGVRGRALDPAIVAADRVGSVATVSLGSAATLAGRAAGALGTSKLVVVALPDGAAGRAALLDLERRRLPGQLLLVSHLPPTPIEGAVGRVPARFYALPAFGLAGGSGTGSVTSGTTRRRGLVSTVDIAPTVLRHLGLAVPAAMRGEPIRAGAERSAEQLEQARRRWSDVRGGRQASSLYTVVAMSAVVLLLLGTLRGAGAAARPALRAGALAVMWWPVMVLGAAAVAPAARFHEVLLIAVSSVLAGLATDAVLRWPRGPVLPAAACLLAYTADLATGGELLTRSVLGPSILSGGRFYGISNELEPLLPILALVGLAALVGSRPATWRLPAIYGGVGIGLGFLMGWGRLGADVGGVITVTGAFTAATLVVRGRRLTRRSALVALVVPVAGLLALVVVDLGLGGGAHLSRNLTRSEGFTDLAELVARRYQLMAVTLTNPSTLLRVAGAVLAVSFAIRNRALLYAPVRTAAWRAALVGGLAGGVVGALSNDSGPVLLINGVIGLAAVTAYLQGQAPVSGIGQRLAAPGGLGLHDGGGDAERRQAGSPATRWASSAVSPLR